MNAQSPHASPNPSALSTPQPPPGDAESRRQIVERLEHHAQSVAPFSRVRLYGSSSCALNADGADLDCTLETARPMSHAEQARMGAWGSGKDECEGRV